MAAHLMNSNKNGVSAHEIHRALGVTYKTAWFMMHRLREAMIVSNDTPMGGSGSAIQADETYWGNTSKRSKSYRKGLKRKAAIVALVDAETGEARTFHVRRGVSASDVREILVTNVDRKSTLVTDESKLYTKTGAEFGDHQTMNHSGREYVNAAGFTVGTGC